MTLFQYTGSAVTTTLPSGILAADTSIPLGAAIGWPDGAGSFVFVATLGDSTNGDTEEKILCSSRTGSTLTVSQRGYDDTSAQDWAQGTLIRHTLSAVAMQEASDHIADSTIHLSVADHAAISHTQAMMGANSVGAAQIIASAVGTTKIDNGAVTLAKLAAAVQEALCPVGSILAYSGATAPTGWGLCQGQEESRATYAALFAIIGELYGSGDGSTTFNFPDLRQRFPLGKADSGMGSTLGANGGTFSHTHGLNGDGAAALITARPSGNDSPQLQRLSGLPSWTANIRMSGGANAAAGTESHGDGTRLTGDTQGANPPYQVVNYIIRTG